MSKLRKKNFFIGHTPRHMVGKDASGGKEDEILYILHSVGAKR